ncbi:MAG TPA: PAS domain S-box protein [Perlabentimonas sp.]|jgi:PAS domain S-box-containing protein|nr:PAS domain S-box protein [Bacteroidales bacterium]MDD4671904.1 PAS domain S-box protein [Bacteroidales bacterium]MDY0348682.1 PAS domain S-box protein [Tenuifilaceae bacterium]HZJ73405.1 PAS domain S-box protein [Perlabentimonas sp.]
MNTSDRKGKELSASKGLPGLLPDSDSALLSTMFNSCAGSIYLLQNNRIVFHNKQFEVLTGYSSHELSEMNFTDLVHEKDRKLIKLLFLKDYMEIREKKTSRSFTFRAVRKSGQMRWFKSNVSVISYKGSPALLDNCFDITQQKDSERKLVEEEQNFRLLVNGFEDMVFIISKRGLVIQANRSVYNRLGFSEHQVALKAFNSFFSANQRESVKTLISDVFSGNREIYSGSLVRSNSKSIPIEARLFKGNWSQKEVVFAICQDVTQRLESEHIVKMSEEKFGKAFENNAVMMVISTFEEGRFIDVNETFLKKTGLTREQIVGANSSQIKIFPDISQRDELKQLIIKEGRIQEVETSLLNTFGQQLVCSFSAEIIEIQEELCLLFVISDITDKKRAQEEILRSEIRFRQLAELLPEKVFEANSQGYLTFANNYLKSFFNYTDKAIAQGLHIYQLFDAKHHDIISSYLNNSIVTPELPSVELMALKSDNSTFPVLTHIIAIVENNRISRYMGVMVDISAQKNQEQELVKAKNEAEQASRAKERFLSTMSHEIRTPMNAVIGMTNILLSEKPMEHQLAYLQSLKYSAEGLMSLLNDVLDFSKIEAGKHVVNSKAFDLEKFAKGVYKVFKYSATKKGIDLSLSYDDTLPANVVSDSGKLNQILTNLTSNAIKFTAKGGVGIEFKKVRETAASVWVRFSVSDTGIGIPIDKQKVIFKEFVQANANTTRQYGGTGLGLAISHKLVSVLKGSLEVTSSPSKGSEFFFTLSLRKSKVAKKNTSDLVTKPISISKLDRPVRVLVVEDNEINSFIVLKFLKDWGFDTQLAENGAEAVSMVRNNSYDLILMDLEMPVMSGYEATKEIRAMTDTSKCDIPIIALTASAMLDVQHKIFNLGMNGFILKPFKPADLKAKIFELIESK